MSEVTDAVEEQRVGECRVTGGNVFLDQAALEKELEG